LICWRQNFDRRVWNGLCCFRSCCSLAEYHPSGRLLVQNIVLTNMESSWGCSPLKIDPAEQVSERLRHDELTGCRRARPAMCANLLVASFPWGHQRCTVCTRATFSPTLRPGGCDSSDTESTISVKPDWSRTRQFKALVIHIVESCPVVCIQPIAC
jgi:hypothetical protein